MNLKVEASVYVTISLFTIFHTAGKTLTASPFNNIGLTTGVISAVIILLGLAIILAVLIMVR